MEAYYHSINTFGAVDGPGIRYVLFLAGCELACNICHNPDTWVKTGLTITIEEIMTEMEKYRTFYEKSGGGITVSGGEPLLQSEFVAALFAQCKANGINTALDTGGFAPQSALEKILPNTDLVLFSLKAADNKVHRDLTGKDNNQIIDNLFFAAAKCPLALRYVVIPGINDTEADLAKLVAIIKNLPSTVQLDLLPYHTMGKVKWQELKIPYKLDHVPDATKADIQRVKDFFARSGLKNDYVS